MTSKERIEYLVNLAGGRAEMSRKLGVKYQAINSWYSSGKVSMSCINSIHSLLPWISLNWLIYGEGDVEIYGKEHKRILGSLESLERESEMLKSAISEKIEEIKKYKV